MDQTYIHFGSDHFDQMRFAPIRNSEWQPKPEGGLWASRVDAEYGWKQWCEDNHFGVDELQMSFKFTLSEAHVLLLEDISQLNDLPKQIGRAHV